MRHVCSRCGEEMDLTLRTLHFHEHMITHVPIYTCSKCDRSEVHARVKEVLKEIIQSLYRTPGRKKIAFEEYSEYALLLMRIIRDRESGSIEEAAQDRIDDLLDLMLLAKSLKDEEWMKELSDRLKQVI